MADNLSAAAQAMGIPEALVKRSAEARAKATGASVEEVLAAWAGGGAVPASAPPTEPAAAEETPAAPEPQAQPEPEAAPRSQPQPQPQPQPVGAQAVSRPPAPERVTPEEALDHPVVVSVPTAGLKERTSSAIPRWLAAAFTIIPVFGLLYLAGTIGSAEACDPAGIVLAVDRQTGVPVNCDGTEFTGRGAAGGGIGQFLAMGEEAYVTCAGCHGPTGGGGVGPALNAVVNLFPSCENHVEWVALGTQGFQAAGRQTYGALGKPVGGEGIMPGFAASLSEEQLRAVVAFERIRFGGAAPEEAMVECGLVEPEGETVEPGEGEPVEPGGEGETVEPGGEGEMVEPGQGDEAPAPAEETDQEAGVPAPSSG